MATQQGMEGRYLNRFAKIQQQTGASIKNYDSAGNLTEHLQSAKASLRSQENNTKQLFATAQELIIGIDTSQQMFGHTFVRNMPLPSVAIKESPSQQLGYVQLTMRFLQAGVVHFMEQMSEATDRIEHLESLLAKLAVYDEDIDVLGDLQSLDLDKLEASISTTLKAEAVKHEDITKPIPSPISPPLTPVNEAKSKLSSSSSSVSSSLPSLKKESKGKTSSTKK